MSKFVVRLQVLLWAVPALVFIGPAAHATVVEPVTPGFDFFDFSTPANVVLLVGFLIPIITGIIVKEVAHPGVKAVSTLVLSIIAATVGTIVGTDGGWAWRDFGNAFLSAFVPAIAMYYGFLKPAGVTGAVQRATADFGVLVKAKDVTPVVTDPSHAEVGNTGEVVSEVAVDGTLTVADDGTPTAEAAENPTSGDPYGPHADRP